MKKRLGTLLACLLLVFTTACSSGKSEEGTSTGGETAGKSEASNGKVELSLWMFTGTGLEGLIEKYQQEHENIKINVQTQEYNDHHNGLMTALAAGSGGPDIAMIEIGFIDKFKSDEKLFHNLADHGANDIMGDYLEWKRVQASSQDGSFIYGIPTDVGPMAMYYRTDLFEQAGLPTEPAAVAELMPTWEKFIEVGKTIKDKTGKPMVYGADIVYQSIRGQAKEQYFNSNGDLIVETNPAIKRAWDLSTEIANSGLAAKISAWSPEWGAGMNNGDFTVMLGPSWMVGYMKGNAPDSSGKWNLAPMPEGSGNWGGSFMTVPSQSKHPKEAMEFLKWLLSPEQQLELFKENGSNFPSTPAVYDDPAIQTYTDEFFQNAPLGKTFSDAAKKVVPVYLGPDHITVDTPILQALANVERNGEAADAAWQTAMDQIKRDLRR
ncbi:sugar ABC transporter periplasmic protein [Paenibacillus algicola]|uniref:Sugar ABC transporter periplasmic protein n=1 Tax=Paenibacillus algicola TaxID=2565926 RepID=A0A4P8XFD5_9BACL|nr:extracellular solute-binding protein [Paenibacillus algicola]QCT01082.1 sugar ABC transporter periplasmic protein [Paenibacillus algicola]